MTNTQSTEGHGVIAPTAVCVDLGVSVWITIEALVVQTGRCSWVWWNGGNGRFSERQTGDLQWGCVITLYQTNRCVSPEFRQKTPVLQTPDHLVREPIEG